MIGLVFRTLVNRFADLLLHTIVGLGLISGYEASQQHDG